MTQVLSTVEEIFSIQLHRQSAFRLKFGYAFKGQEDHLARYSLSLISKQAGMQHTLTTDSGIKQQWRDNPKVIIVDKILHQGQAVIKGLLTEFSTRREQTASSDCTIEFQGTFDDLVVNYDMM